LNILSIILRELLGLFIDDEFLAVALLAVVALASSLILLAEAPPLLAGGMLLVGCLGVLTVSVIRGSQKV
jgi:hypothetical protein